MMDVLVLVLGIAVTAVLALTPAIQRSRSWKATVTPLASIMGSGFLVSAPLLVRETGLLAPFAMAALLIVTYGVGAMIRFNICFMEPEIERKGDTEHSRHVGHRDRTEPHWRAGAAGPPRLAGVLEQVSHLALAGAYVVSVSYYLQLLSAFVLGRGGVTDVMMHRWLTTGLLSVITGVGVLWGLRALERVEIYAVSLNLGMIAALLVGLAIYNASAALAGHWSLAHVQTDPNPLHAVRSVIGLLIIVQGFETSRFLGAEHPREERIVTMRRAQIIAAAIYLAFTTLALVLFGGGRVAADVTAIVRLVRPVASVLPMLIVVTAAASQFSASVADDAGCAGLTETLLGRRLSPRWGYALIGVATIGLTWATNVLSVISLASRAFALFYALQCGVAVWTAHDSPDIPHRRRVMGLGSVLAAVCVGVTVFGIPAG